MQVIDHLVRAVLLEGHKGHVLKARLKHVAQGECVVEIVMNLVTLLIGTFELSNASIPSSITAFHSLTPSHETLKDFTCTYGLEDEHKTIPQACLDNIRALATPCLFTQLEGVITFVRDHVVPNLVSDQSAELRLRKLAADFCTFTTRNTVDLEAHDRLKCLLDGIVQAHKEGDNEERKTVKAAIEFHHVMGDLQKATTNPAPPMAC